MGTRATRDPHLLGRRTWQRRSVENCLRPAPQKGQGLVLASGCFGQAPTPSAPFPQIAARILWANLRFQGRLNLRKCQASILETASPSRGPLNTTREVPRWSKSTPSCPCRPKPGPHSPQSLHPPQRRWPGPATLRGQEFKRLFLCSRRAKNLTSFVRSEALGQEI